MAQITHRIAALAGIAIVAIAVLTGPTLAAQLTSAGTFRNLANEQTGPSTVVPNGAFFNGQGTISAPGAFDTATLTYPGPGSPQNLPFNSPTAFGNGPSFPSKAAMDTAYPFGSYTFTVKNSGTNATDSRTVNYTADAYTADTPQLTPGSFNALQALSTQLHSLTVDFNSFIPSTLATSAFTYFTVFGSNQGCGALSPSATSCTIDPRALVPSHTYTWELDFSDRIEATVNGALTFTDFDVRTDGTFTTAAFVPEPASLMILVCGLGMLLAIRRSPGSV